MAFTAPIGTADERGTGLIWPGRWTDATGYDKLYSLGYHTGADLNLNYPYWNKDAHSEVYAMGKGVVTYAKLYSTQYWGRIVVIDHGQVNGMPLFSRYAHVENIGVEKDDEVEAGQQIAKVGNGDGLFSYHLHFDISTTDILREKPGHWPGYNRTLVHAHYVNPQEWLQLHLEGGPENLAVLVGQVYYVTATLGLRVRKDHSKSARQVGSLTFGSRININDSETVDQDGLKWAPITAGQHTGDWLAMGTTNQSEMYVSRFPPEL